MRLLQLLQSDPERIGRGHEGDVVGYYERADAGD